MRVMFFKLLVIVVLLVGLFSCDDKASSNDIAIPCDFKDIVFVNEGTLICEEINSKIYAGGQVHLMGKDKSVFKFYILSKSKDDLKVENTYTYESDSYGYSKNTQYLFRDGYVVAEFKKQNDDILSYSIPLKGNNLSQIGDRLKLFERSIEEYALEYNIN